jgi:endonuclease/exonuclease/phosphatase family metal-dependent hydrolase
MITHTVKALFLYSTLLLSLLIPNSRGDGNGKLKVMSLNVRYDNPADAPNDWKARLPLIIRTINEQSPNIIGFQEVLKNQLDDLDSLLPSYAYIGVGREDGKDKGEFSPVFYKKDHFEVMDQGTLWLSETPLDTGSIGWDAALPRIVTWAKFRDKGNPDDENHAELYFLNTHFDHVGDTARLESVRLILDFIKNETDGNRIVLCGDFNFDPSQDPYALITEGTEDLTGLQDACNIAKEKKPCNEPTFNGFGKGSGYPRIDYIFLGKGWVAQRYETLKVKDRGVFISDHYPILLQLNP